MKGKEGDRSQSHDILTQSVSLQSSTADSKSTLESGVKDISFKGIRTKESRKSQSEGSLTTMLLMVSFTFVILTGPIYAFYVAYIFKNNMESAQALADYVMAGNICNQMLLTNYAINFYLYCLGGSKFRSDLKKTLKAICN